MSTHYKMIVVLIIVLTLASACGQPEPTPLPASPTDPVAPPTEAAEQPVPEAPPPASAPVADLADLDALFEQSYNQLLLRDPELITTRGLADQFGTGNDQLTDISDAYIRETQQLEAAILDTLTSYDRTGLTPEQTLSLDIYIWHLDDRVRGHEFMYNNYTLNPVITSAHNHWVHFFTQLHPMTNEQDAKDYIDRLSQLDTKGEQLLEGLRLREEAGVILPNSVIHQVQRDLRNITGREARFTPFYITFEEKVNALEGVSDADKQALLEAAENEIAASVIPAYRSLVDYLERQETIATDEDGAWKFPNGEDYYAYALRHHTTTDLTADEVHQLGLQEVDRIQAEMRVLFDELGYPSDDGLPALFRRVAGDGGSLYGDEIVAGYEAIIEAADQDLDVAFDLRPRADVIIIGGASGGYYQPPALDGSRPGAFYASVGGSEPKFGMPTLAYHEAIPGHHFQIAIAQELDLPSFRNGARFTAYTEGWALYAERLAWELGFYEDDPYGNLGRLQGEVWRAVRLVVDTGIHAKGWTYDQALNYMRTNTGLSIGLIEYEIARYIVWPGQATSYKIGMLKILELRQLAMDRLGDRFDLKEFHNVVLANGAMPLDVLEQVVQAYIDAKLAGSAESAPVADAEVQGWAILAQKDDYSDVDMTDILVDYIGAAQMRQVIEAGGWDSDHILELPEFDLRTLQDGLDWLEENADEDDVVFVYVAAHGSYLRDVLVWDEFFAPEWEQIPSGRRLLVIDSCQAANYTAAASGDPSPYLSVAAVNGSEYGWAGIEEEGLPIIGGIFTHYFAAAFDDPAADSDNDGLVSVQEAALMAEGQQRAYMHDVVFAVPEFVEMYHGIGSFPDKDPTFPHVVVDDTIGEPLYLTLDAYTSEN